MSPGKSRRAKSSSAISRSKGSRKCEYPGGCNRSVALDKWEAQGHRCHQHVGLGIIDPSQDGRSNNPFVDASVIFPDLLEQRYSEVVNVRDRSPMAVKTSVAVRTIANVSSGNSFGSQNFSIGISNAKAIVETYNKWSNGQDLSVVENARKRYKNGARLFYEMLSANDRTRNCAGLYLVRVSDMTIRPRVSSRTTTTDKESGAKLNLFKEQRFQDRQHEVICMEIAHSDVADAQKSMFVVDPLIPALAPVSDPKRSVRDNPYLKSTPFTECPWVSNVDDYMTMDRNGSIEWARSELVESRRRTKR